MEEKLEQLTMIQSVLIGLGLAGFYYFFVYSVANYDSVINDSNQKIEAANAEIVKVDELIREKQELEAELLKNEELVKSSNEVSTKEFDTDVALEQLTTKARSYGLAIESIGTFSQWDPGLQFSRSELGIGLKGTFSQLMFFLSDFTREEGFYSFNSLKLNLANENSVTNKGNDLNIDLRVVILKRTNAEEKEALKNPETF